MKNIFAAFIALGFFTQVYGAQADGAPATACVYQYKGEVLLIEPGYETWLPLRSAVTLRARRLVPDTGGGRDFYKSLREFGNAG